MAVAIVLALWATMAGAGGVPAWAAGARASDSATATPMIFTVAGQESSAVAAPEVCLFRDFGCSGPLRPAPWTSGARVISGSCLSHFADGSMLLCHGDWLLRLRDDGRIERWPQRPESLASLRLGELRDADVAPDGSVVALGEADAARIAADGAVMRLRLGEWDAPMAIEALSDSATLLAEDGRAVRVTPDGRMAVMARRLGSPNDVSAIADGGFVAIDEYTNRVLRVDRTGLRTVIAGGGRRWRENARATDVRLSELTAVEADDDGGLWLGASRGLLRMNPDGRIHTAVGGVGESYPAPANARAVNTDGRSAASARLTGIARIAVRNGSPLVLTGLPELGLRLAAVTPIAQADRLAIALPPRDRRLLLGGHLDIVATRPATAQLQVLLHGRVIRSTTLSLTAGVTTVPLRVAASTEAHVLRVTATSESGATATHVLTVLPGRVLARRVVRRLENAISLVGVSGESDGVVSCRHQTARRFACRAEWRSTGEPVLRTRGVLRLRKDGLIAYTERAARRSRPLTLIFEPPTFDPRPG